MEASPTLTQTRSAPHALSTEPINLDLIDIPADTRDHDPQEIEVTARNLQELGQLQPIAVLAKEGTRYDLIFGKGRYLAARKAGKTTLEARVYQGLTPYQRLDMIYSENERREPSHPLYRARVLQGMVDTGEFKTRSELAKQQGMSEGMLSDYLSFLKFPAEAIQIFSMLKISFRALQEVKALTPDQQCQVAQELKGGTLKPEQVLKRCRQLRFGAKRGPAPRASQPPAMEPVPPTPDPLAELWEKMNGELLYQVTYRGGMRWSIEVSAPPVPKADDWGLAVVRHALGNFFRKLGNVVYVEAPPEKPDAYRWTLRTTCDLPAPALSEPVLYPGRRILLRWKKVQEARAYQVLYGPRPDQLKPIPHNADWVEGLEARISASDNPAEKLYFAVRAYSPKGDTGSLSEIRVVNLAPASQQPPIEFEATPPGEPLRPKSVLDGLDPETRAMVEEDMKLGPMK